MPKYLLPVFLVLSMMGAGCASSQPATSQTSNSQPANAQASASSDNSAVKTYTLDDIAQHATASNCWMAISGKVYDVTSYIPNHPGGDKILGGCGKDATQMFGAIKDGKGHSDYARSLMGDYYIGDLK